MILVEINVKSCLHFSAHTSTEPLEDRTAGSAGCLPDALFGLRHQNKTLSELLFPSKVEFNRRAVKQNLLFENIRPHNKR